MDPLYPLLGAATQQRPVKTLTDLVYTVVICEVRRLVRELWLLSLTSYKFSVDGGKNSKRVPAYSPTPGSMLIRLYVHIGHVRQY